MGGRLDDVTLGILAGGEGRRFGGRDKAWIEFAGEPLVLRQVRRLGPWFAQVRVSANRNGDLYRRHGLSAVADAGAPQGPLSGVAALLAHCTTAWLMTVPVDAHALEPAALHALRAAAERADGAVAAEPDGLQPMLALYRVAPMRGRVDAALAAGRLAVREVQAQAGFAVVALAACVGNLNTPAALAAAEAGGARDDPARPDFRPETPA
ncbi:molybdenum cofactor guanylyltransferase [Coralloluteibacterium stylophorae]|uniref:Molybdenum cofactor guanylyltransferase n=1 Tax=Coralloluteibacterium stylophorae TaxID=1776034 RepID=A0A8J8B055_9GAMM|nr:NTP transferase domain-containing protein [Coralloluteibacterium stylophorae]MBS7455963.1 NTP transferase domain-containing protein [Coralloluteibacterium stylophorae]